MGETIKDKGVDMNDENYDVKERIKDINLFV